MAHGLLADGGIIQICFVTEDLDGSATWLGELFAVAPGPVVEVKPDENARYRSERGQFTCRIRFIQLPNITIEVIEPGPEKSAWRDLLEQKGPGFHHLGIKTRNLTRDMAWLEGKGHELIQIGDFAGGGGRYAYFNTVRELGGLVELLESDDDMEPQPPVK